MNFRWKILLLSLCCALSEAFAAVPALEREVNLMLNNEPAGNVLKKIQEQTGLVFSYSTKVLNAIPPLSANIRRKTVREALVLMLPKSITYKSKNNYVILKERPAEKPQKKTELSGYVIDRNTEQKIANVTVYDKNSMQSATTDEYGFYKITVPSEQQNLNVNKVNYEDTVIAVADVKDQGLTNIALQPVKDSVRLRDSIDWRVRLKEFGTRTNQLFKNFSGYVNTLNIQDTLHRPFQLSLFPYVGTNHRLSGNVINHLSINLFGGYARGVEGLEAGGFFNIDKSNVRGAQFAGFFNLVGDTLDGIQGAGFFNMNGRRTEGFQAAGFFNSNLGTMDGFSAAGFTNLNRKQMKGLQLAGFFNLAADSMVGMQGAGFMNLAGDLDGFQGAGFMNCAETMDGAQVAGFMNVADSADGVQVAGFLNHAKFIDGAQVSGFLNTAKTVHGYQIGIVNVSDSCKGVPIGLFNFVRHGLHQLEVSGDEVFYANLSLRTGVPVFHSILSAGINPTGDKALWTFGYALGSSFRISERFRSDLSLGTQHVNMNGFTESNSDLYKFYWGVEYKATPKFSIAAGPTFNLFLSDSDSPDYAPDKVAPYSMFNTTYNNGLNLRGWVGGKIALRFF